MRYTLFDIRQNRAINNQFLITGLRDCLNVIDNLRQSVNAPIYQPPQRLPIQRINHNDISQIAVSLIQINSEINEYRTSVEEIREILVINKKRAFAAIVLTLMFIPSVFYYIKNNSFDLNDNPEIIIIFCSSILYGAGMCELFRNIRTTRNEYDIQNDVIDETVRFVNRTNNHYEILRGLYDRLLLDSQQERQDDPDNYIALSM